MVLKNVKQYVMFGHNHLFGDWLEIIHATGGILKKVVQNIPESSDINRLSLKQRIERLQDPQFNPHHVNQDKPIEIQFLENFKPEADEYYLMGFTGFKKATLEKQLVEKFALEFSILIHPTAIISPTAFLSPGVIINSGTIIASGVTIKEHSSINKGVIIGHDTTVEEYVVIQPGVKIAGHVKVGVGTVVGIGSVIIEDIQIGKYAMIAAGAVVIKNVPDYTLVAGVPAIPKKRINDFLIDTVDIDQKTLGYDSTP
ncbi:hypothetical protein C7H19_16545 [Aphanothece hegewaldii CCALA 016]|uniref:Acetyltransferase n=1 Tax=Aphanothece hegewaldii CCALA 016 TaxID=2107694 RepID=A0A2T1LUU7_9CHRO|nr:hypothetical protein [Aphanothece hegewaldii]PSF35391.1 hypothetical protein C7H19_16545 [Aphanothece hegewaldii CCALA 016]